VRTDNSACCRYHISFTVRLRYNPSPPASQALKGMLFSSTFPMVLFQILALEERLIAQQIPTFLFVLPSFGIDLY
jgi:hypothetical protein